MAKLSDSEIDAFLDGKTDHLGDDQAINDFLDGKTDEFVPPSSIADKIKGLAAQVSPALPAAAELGEAVVNPIGLLRKAPDVARRSLNYITGKPNSPAQTLMEAAANRPDITATVGASLIPGAGMIPAAARIAGVAGASALAPENRTASAVVGGGLQALFEALPYGAGKVGPAARKFFSRLSQTDAKGLKALYDNPSLLFTGPNKAEAQAVYEAAAVKAGLSPEVSDQVLYGAKKTFVRNVTAALDESKEVPTQTLLDARQVLYDLSQVAKRKGEANVARGFMQRHARIQEQLMKQSPEIREADKVWSAMKTREPFTNFIPRNKADEMSLNVPALATGAFAGAKALLGTSPIIQGLTASAMGATAKARPAIQTGVQAIRQYLMGQRGRGPSSR